MPTIHFNIHQFLDSHFKPDFNRLNVIVNNHFGNREFTAEEQLLNARIVYEDLIFAIHQNRIFCD